MKKNWLENNSWFENKKLTKTQKEVDSKLEKKELKQKTKSNITKMKDDMAFDKSIRTVWTKNKVVYKWKEYKVWFKWKTTLVLWNKVYKMKLLALEHDNMQVLQKIKFNWNDVEFTYKSWLFSSKTINISDKMLRMIFSWLINNNWYKKNIPWKDARLVISRL